ncbi:hypothetical protein JCM33374_g1552 [Metschnikowia sp. JCM 33374]|nr:hypothetical protein JCM33374_g1552 [Metschnikowia sp. JCM 33374]
MIFNCSVVFFLIAAATALQAVPFLFASHKLVPGLKKEILQPNTRTQDPVQVTNLIKKAVTECSSDVYVLMNVPGITNGDMIASRKGEWRHLQNYLHMASSVVGLPWIEGTLDLAFLEQYVIRTCKADAIHAYSEHDVADYIDTRKRVIRIETSPLPEGGPARHAALAEADDLLRKILRKSPSPHYTIVITSDVVVPVHPVPDVAIASSPRSFELFHDVVNDPRREEEVERNAYMYQDVEPFWNNAPDSTELYLQRKKNDEVHLFRSELWQKNEKLVATVAMMVASLVIIQTLNFTKWLKNRILQNKTKLA